MNFDNWIQHVEEFYFPLSRKIGFVFVITNDDCDYSWERQANVSNDFILQLTAKTQGWVGLGLSDEEGMTGADLYMGGYDKNGPYLYVSFRLSTESPRAIIYLKARQNLGSCRPAWIRPSPCTP